MYISKEWRWNANLTLGVGPLIVTVGGSAQRGSQCPITASIEASSLGEVLFTLLLPDLNLLLLTASTQLVRLESAFGLVVVPAVLGNVSLRHDFTFLQLSGFCTLYEKPDERRRVGRQNTRDREQRSKTESNDVLRKTERPLSRLVASSRIWQAWRQLGYGPLACHMQTAGGTCLAPPREAVPLIYCTTAKMPGKYQSYKTLHLLVIVTRR